jgi:exopolyphosphatase/guanosine-5'-triphosphate,3'-diphosphate pyrophosphatase
VPSRESKLRGACIDIGSNTTRLLVADRDDQGLHEVGQERVFTHLGRHRLADGVIEPAKIQEVSRVVADQLRRARELGAEEVRAVATAALRRAVNGKALAENVRQACGLEVEILAAEEEARLAFVGAASTLPQPPAEPLAVVDVGGGSCELVVGKAPADIAWCQSFAMGSADLTSSFLCSDPPSARELRAARAAVKEAFDRLRVPEAALALAVGGSATSLRHLTGTRLDPDVLEQGLRLLAGRPALAVAHELGLDPERARLLPAGLLILQATCELFALPLNVCAGGLREGVLLEASQA